MPIGQTSTTPLATVVMASPAAEKPSETILHLATDNDLQDENSQITLYVSGETSINNNEEKFVGCSLNTTLNRHTPMAIFIGCFLTFLFLLGLSIDRNNKIQATIDTQDELDLQHSWLPNVNEQLKGTYLCESRKFRHHWHFLSEQKRNILHQTNNNVTTVLRVEVEIHEQDEADYSATYTLVGTSLNLMFLLFSSLTSKLRHSRIRSKHVVDSGSDTVQGIDSSSEKPSRSPQVFSHRLDTQNPNTRQRFFEQKQRRH
eukprot:TRINITY_DN906_c0_g1_i2.p1 TRINITY_DN906_c0_g1~~TRINITY_DN906_c0_g1_i2.p1  ORF type:complete len:259 (-),score=40.35 TRINITY_DN906_c0_g1_i2:366-1142(-)